MSRPTDQEKKLVTELRGKLGTILKTPEQSSEAFLLRWLRARDLNLEKTESMIRHSLKWREENDVDNVLTRAFDPWMKTNYPFWIEGTDFEGRPVMELALGSWDLRKAVDRGEESELLFYVNKFFESLLHAIRQSNKKRSPEDYPISQVIMIVDWNRYSYAQLMHWKAVQNILKMVATYESHYPEVMYRCFFVNCPSIFPLLMSMMKQLLAPKTIAKITCHSTLKDWEPHISKLVAKDQIATFIGGTRKPSDGAYPY